jgi:acyl dehydratase
MPNSIRKRAIDGLRVGDVFIVSRTFTQQDTVQFGNLTRDYNPVHYDERWADKKGFGGLICHGLLVGSMICEIGGQIGGLASGLTFNFIKPVYFGETVTCTATIREMEEKGWAKAEAVFTNENGELVCRAVLSGPLPRANDRKFLKTITEEQLN